jgi:hypothetical protein
VDLLPLIIAGAAVVALIFRDWLWLRFCRFLYKQSVALGKAPDAELMIRVAGAGRPKHFPNGLLSLPGKKPPPSNDSG